ncbi:MAG: NAD(+)/NADH kinase [Desulfatibacillaceae bacterium]|nr:NAD(+)/NADH kinase [Desulfatibacillaceae bacterium]
MDDSSGRIGLYIKENQQAKAKARELEAWLVERGISVISKVTTPPAPDITKAPQEKAPDDLSLMVALGGDGTFLSAARYLGTASVPILGVKFGEVGFLSEITHDRLFEAMEAILKGDYQTRARTRLLVTVKDGDQTLVEQTVLNDAVVTNGALARLANIHTSVNGKYLTTYRADGLIVATPTGSTAYCLAAGGPIVHPEVPAVILAPICPFTLTNRPLIVPDSSAISLHLEKPVGDVTLSFDGQAGLKINEKHEIVITRSPYPTNMVKVGGQHYFDVLKTKLRWGGGP